MPIKQHDREVFSGMVFAACYFVSIPFILLGLLFALALI